MGEERWTTSMVCRVEGENGKWERMWANLQQREQRDGSPSSGGGALGPLHCVGQPFFSRRKRKQKRKRLWRRGRVRGVGRGRGGGGCEEKVGGECGLLVWCGAARVACSFDPVLKKKEGVGKNPRLGWSLNRFPGGSVNECKFMKVGHL